MMRRLDFIVIGGSVGALAPLLDIVGALPDALTAPIGIVLHLPARPSVLPELIARVTRRAVHEAEDKQVLAPNTIHIAPPNYHMLVERTGTIALSVDEPVNFSRPSIDVLFESAADAFGARLAGLVLSGSNADGAAGLARVERVGGIALVQADAEYPEMPNAARRRAGAARMLAAPEVAPFLGHACAMLTTEAV